MMENLAGLLSVLALASASSAKVPPPTIFPAPGTYFNTTSLSLRDEVPDTEIHYTWDGSEPTASSPVYDQREVLFIGGVYDGNKGLQTGYTLRAIAIRQGMAASDPVTFSYRIEQRDRTAYISEEVAPGVRMIRDCDNDKMFLIRGSKRYALIDSGMGRGELRNYISQFTGGLPLVAIFTHSHGDHIGQSDQFIAESTEYIGAGDRDATADFLQKHGATREQIAAHLKTVTDGSKVDLGDRALAMDEGNDALVPSYRPRGIKQIVVGDRFTDPNWFGMNVNAQTFLPAPPDEIASLTLMELQGATLTTRFTSTTHDYQANVKGSGPITISVKPASSRVESITINGDPVQPGAPVDVSFRGRKDVVAIGVTAHDGQTKQAYRVVLSR